MIFAILIGASIFSLIFRGVGGDALVDVIFELVPGGKYSALLFVMLMIFLLGFILDFIEICYVFILACTTLLMMGFDPVWLACSSYQLTDFFLNSTIWIFTFLFERSRLDASIKTHYMYQGVVPFILMQIAVLLLVILFPVLVL